MSKDLVSIPKKYYEGLKPHFQANGLPWLPIVAEELVYQIGRNGLEDFSPNAFRYYKEGTRSMFDAYKHLEAKGKGHTFESRVIVRGEAFVIGCNYQ